MPERLIRKRINLRAHTVQLDPEVQAVIDRDLEPAGVLVVKLAQFYVLLSFGERQQTFTRDGFETDIICRRYADEAEVVRDAFFGAGFTFPAIEMASRQYVRNATNAGAMCTNAVLTSVSPSRSSTF